MKTLRYVGHAVNHTVVVCAIVVLVTFLLVRIIPGDPVVSIQGIQSTPAARAAMREQLHLDRSLPVAFELYLRDLASGNLGTSLVQQNRPVAAIIRQSLPITLALIGMTICISLCLGVPLGMWAAISGSGIDTAVRGAATFFLALPPFFLGLLLLWVLGLEVHLLPPGGWGDSVVDNFKHLILPSLALSGFLTPLIIRVTREATRQSLRQPWFEAGIARGLSRHRLLYAHLLPNGLVPVITLVGYNVGALITGAVVVESVFALPGIGEALFNAINARDYPVVQGIALISALAVVGSNLAADLVSSSVDPRIRRA